MTTIESRRSSTPTNDAHRMEVVDDMLGAARAVVAPKLRTAIDALPQRIGRIVAYHLGWAELDGGEREGEGSWGKGIRSALVLACAEAVGGDALAAVPAAVATELMHNASLIHDDIIDGDDLRRHQLAVWAAYGSPAAILAGDSLLVASIQALLRSSPQHALDGLEVLTAAGQQLIEGEQADVTLETFRFVSVNEVLTMIEGKTAALLKCACVLGAVYGGSTEDRVDALGRFGRDLGMAFQGIDDLLGIWGSDATGKPVLSDIWRRKKSLPVVVALQAGTPASAELAAIYDADDPLSDAQVQRAAELIEKTGARGWVRDYANEQIASALTHLDRAHPTAHGRDQLTAIARRVVERNT
ncbi:polyprenyl synthetase family protein (plasmid) [Nocardia sp. CA-084685]|uniref:polyprenyl synthetase family protein n=1 Tax=Nocardia sp. CA-084685 TaxID=3239970 RepID=UPI003D981A2F